MLMNAVKSPDILNPAVCNTRLCCDATGTLSCHVTMIVVRRGESLYYYISFFSPVLELTHKTTSHHATLKTV